MSDPCDERNKNDGKCVDTEILPDQNDPKKEAWDDVRSNEKQAQEEKKKIAAISDLSDLSRKICVVTTAALPWRTGTAVNPLARALYLTRGRKKHSVTLMIPWLETKAEQAKVYGSNVFDSQQLQKLWIQKYSRERILDINETDTDSNDEVDNLQISFYPAKYHALFGSIFATVDICELIPKNDADVAILEEPEHLTWFRVPISSKSSTSNNKENTRENCTSDDEDTTETETTTLATTIMDSNDSSCASLLNNSCDGDDDVLKNRKELQDQAIIGWTAKFSYVVGILHTNYSAYMKQYGLGTSIVTASALQALSSVCVRAYTHRLIRLSDTLPELDTLKEITCNVHGVRSEFFDVDDSCQLKEAAVPEVKDEIVDENSAIFSNFGSTNGDDGNEEVFVPQPIYFIGKVIWAKGFDKILEIEDLYRKSTGEYFSIDVYGSGPDSDAISRAFLGRSGITRVLSSDSVKSMGDASGTKSPKRGRSKSPIPPSDKTAALVFSREGNLRRQIEDGETVPSDTLIVEVQTCEIPVDSDTGTRSSARKVPILRPRDVITHLKDTTIETKTGVTKAIVALSDRITTLGLHSLYSEEHDQESSDCDTNKSGEEREGTKFKFDPPKSRYELRRNPVPARFLGVKDHALLRDIPQHKIFINLSITEVLCTTTAEALAMGKFVIIPNHPSNTFFLQFPNCLSFETKLECVEKIKFALQNDPVSLSPEKKYILTWEGANIRLFESSAISEAEAENRNKKTGDFARMHMDSMKTMDSTMGFLQGLVHRGHKPQPRTD